MKVNVWYNKVGDSAPTFVSKKLLNRPDDFYFECEVSNFKESYRYGLSWSGGTPSLVFIKDTESELNLERGLAQIDLEVQEADKQPFTFNGHIFYPDTEFIQGVFSVLPLLPTGYTENWKTAEKDTDGVNNVYVTLDKAGIQGLALAYLQFKKNNWLSGELQKQALKDAFLEEQ